MSEVQKKYTILPGVATPNINEILAATSDYTDPGEIDFTITHHENNNTDKKATVIPQSAELQELQNLGKKVEEDENRAKAESQKKMDAIMNSAVMAPQSLDTLKEVAAQQEIDDDRREQIELERKAREDEAKKQREIDEARRERRAQQQKAFEDMLASKAENPQPVPVKVENTEDNAVAEVTEVSEDISEETPEECNADIKEQITEDKVEEVEVKPEAPVEPEVISLIDSDDDSSRVLSDEETADSFSSFLDDL